MRHVKHAVLLSKRVNWFYRDRPAVLAAGSVTDTVTYRPTQLRVFCVRTATWLSLPPVSSGYQHNILKTGKNVTHKHSFCFAVLPTSTSSQHVSRLFNFT
jgi:hypothetical protein